MTTSAPLPALRPGVTYLWTVWIGGRPTPGERSILSPDEAARADRFVFDRDRSRFVACRKVLRTLLSHYLGVQAPEVVLEYTRYGKPYLPRTSGREPLEFNVSHCEDWALIGITPGRRLGVDLERLRVLDDLDGLARSVFSPRELAVLAKLPEEQRSEAFFNCWTRKEAFIKACGEGLSHPLQEFDVTLAPGEPAAILAIRSGEGSVGDWSLTDLRLLPGYIGAAAADDAHMHFEMAGSIVPASWSPASEVT